MKTFKIIVLIAVALTSALTVSAKKKESKTVVFDVTLDCGSCKAKIEKNIPYEKGVKKLAVDMEAQTVTITYKDDKTTEVNLKKAIEKLEIPVKGIEVCTAKKDGKKACAEKKDCTKKCTEKK